MNQVYLLTGRPGTGKTSLIKQSLAEVSVTAGGFYTEEIRNQGIREGFKLITLDGHSTTLAHVKIQSRYRVGKYGVDIDALDKVGVSSLQQASQQCELIVVDEIGKMELFSASFREAILKIIDSGQRLLGTIMLSPNPRADAIKRQPQVKLVLVTGTNHIQVLDGLRHWLKDLAGIKTDD
jgi:nucleoside-triphosphatase